ncbi:MAG: DUF6438 domain-containing protein [Flavobacteriales bacterium]
MKKILYILLTLSLVIVSCKSRKEAKEKQEATIAEESKLPVSQDDAAQYLSAEQAALEPEDREVGIAVLSISKSVCFGVCPAYSAQIFKDGTMLYEGIKNVKNIGKFKGKVDLNQLEATINEVVSIGYFKLNAVYDNKYVTDVPTVTTYINNKGKAKKVICRFECDPLLTKANKAIEALVNSIELSQIEVKK